MILSFVPKTHEITLTWYWCSLKKWHGRPAREDTRKMRVPHQTASVPSDFTEMTTDSILKLLQCGLSVGCSARAEWWRRFSSGWERWKAGGALPINTTNPLNRLGLYEMVMAKHRRHCG